MEQQQRVLFITRGFKLSIYLHKHFPQRHSGPGKENYSTVLVVWSGFWADICFCFDWIFDLRLCIAWNAWKGRDGMGWRHICIISLAGGLLRIFLLGFVLSWILIISERY
jgi:hypothetical protein